MLVKDLKSVIVGTIILHCAQFFSVLVKNEIFVVCITVELYMGLYCYLFNKIRELKQQNKMIEIGSIISGIISNLLTDTFLSKNEKNDQCTREIPNQQDKIETAELIQVDTYVDQLGERLSLSKELLSSRNERLTYSKIYEYLNYNSVTLIEEYFTGKKEASKKFLIDYADFFGLEYNWLRHGDDNIFKIGKEYPLYPLQYKNTIIELRPVKIFFVRSDSFEGNSGIVIQLTNKKYIILKRTYHISGELGGRGMIQLFRFYKLILELKKVRMNCTGLILKKECFNKLFCGMIYPEKVIEENRKGKYWWDDLLDVDYQYSRKVDYENHYGKAFVDAQYIIKLKLAKVL